MIKIDNKEFEYVEGMTVAEALNLSGESIDLTVIVLLDGKVISRSDLDKIYIYNNSKISILRLISGG